MDDGVLWTLDFTDFGTCIDCNKGMQTNNNSKGAKRSSEMLEIIHTNTSGLYPPCLNSQRYFISFINDCTRYMYLYLINHKNEILVTFKIYKAEVRKQKEQKIKIIRSDKGEEYYGRFTEKGQMVGPFAKFL